MDATIEISPDLLTTVYGGEIERAPEDIVLGHTLIAGALFGGATWLANKAVTWPVPKHVWNRNPRATAVANGVRIITTTAATLYGAKVGFTNHY